MIQALLFDLDDTLCDTIGSREARMRFALRGITDVSVEDVVRTAMTPGPLPREVVGIHTALSRLGRLSEHEIADVTQRFHFEFGSLMLFPGVLEMLSSLSQRFPLGVVSNAVPGIQHQKLDALGLTPYFRAVIVSGEVGYEKPDPRLFALAADALGVTATDCLFVGDRLDVDIAGARAAGMQTVWFNHWDDVLGADDRPDHVIEHFADLGMIVSNS